MRYFAELAYNGSNYYGWQRQPRQISIQEELEKAFSTILGQNIDVVGCGRTDAGVHAKQYFLHFDFDKSFPRAFVQRINKFLPKAIAIFRVFQVSPNAHARFDATHRAYEYHIDFEKNPFGQDTNYYYPFAKQPDFAKLQAAASLLLNYSEFYPFCKSKTEVKTMKCQLKRAEWVEEQMQKKLVFHIAADRFLRGMVRLIVGMCLNVSLGKLTLKELKEAMDKQERLPKSLSVPPQGLYLTDIRYPY